MTYPWHSVQLSSGDYTVSHGRSPGEVSVVGVDGRVVQRYTQSLTSDIGQMKHPRSLAVTKNDILVADEGHDRIVLIKRSTGCIEELALSVDCGILRPRALCLDESRGRLCVGEFGGERRVWSCDCVGQMHAVRTAYTVASYIFNF